MKIWHFIIILLLVAVPSSATWLYYDSQRESDNAGLFGKTEVNSQPAPIPPIFWEDSIDVETGETSSSSANLFDEVLSEVTTDQITNTVLEEYLEPLEEPATENQSEAEDATPVKKAIPVEIEEDEPIEP